MMAKFKDIPVVPLGPGSQPQEEDGAELEYISMPHQISRFEAPDLPDPESVRDLLGAKQTMEWLRDALDAYEPYTEPLMANISKLDDANRELVNQILGDGEVSIRYDGIVRARMQESVLAGVWRTFYVDEDNRIVQDLIEVGGVPYLARMPGKPGAITTESLRAIEPPPEATNGRAVLSEICEAADSYRLDKDPHVVNLTLLPISPEDLTFLESSLGQGPVNMLSRGYGNCHISSTALPNVWWVRFTNSVGTLILNTIEIVDVPGVARAAPEDIADSKRRLADILEAYWKEES
jgi:hydrogenase-1 operon protein HyaF